MKYFQLCGLALMACSILLYGCGGQSDSSTPTESTEPDTSTQPESVTDEDATSDMSQAEPTEADTAQAEPTEADAPRQRFWFFQRNGRGRIGRHSRHGRWRSPWGVPQR